MKIYNYIQERIDKNGAAMFLLIDPDSITAEYLNEIITEANKSDIDAFLIGGSILVGEQLKSYIDLIKSNSTIPVILFPGDINQIIPEADAVLFISLISGRNPENLIGKHVAAAPIIKNYKIEPLSTGYILIDSGKPTTAQYMSGTFPIPSNKPEIATATALAGQYIGMKFIYLEGGSGAENSVPSEMIKMVSNSVSVPVIVGGGIKSIQDIKEKTDSGGKIIVVGNFFENKENLYLLNEFVRTVHYKR